MSTPPLPTGTGVGGAAAPSASAHEAPAAAANPNQATLDQVKALLLAALRKQPENVVKSSGVEALLDATTPKAKTSSANDMSMLEGLASGAADDENVLVAASDVDNKTYGWLTSLDALHAAAAVQKRSSSIGSDHAFLVGQLNKVAQKLILMKTGAIHLKAIFMEHLDDLTDAEALSNLGGCIATVVKPMMELVKVVEDANDWVEVAFLDESLYLKDAPKPMRMKIANDMVARRVSHELGAESNIDSEERKHMIAMLAKESSAAKKSALPLKRKADEKPSSGGGGKAARASPAKGGDHSNLTCHGCNRKGHVLANCRSSGPRPGAQMSYPGPGYWSGGPSPNKQHGYYGVGPAPGAMPHTTPRQ
jgi:hypothetical protein